MFHLQYYFSYFEEIYFKAISYRHMKKVILKIDENITSNQCIIKNTYWTGQHYHKHVTLYFMLPINNFNSKKVMGYSLCLLKSDSMFLNIKENGTKYVRTFTIWTHLFDTFLSVKMIKLWSDERIILNNKELLRIIFCLFQIIFTNELFVEFIWRFMMALWGNFTKTSGSDVHEYNAT